MTVLLRRRATNLTELMDDPACDPRALERTYARFDVVNRSVSGWGRLWRRRLRPLLRQGPVSVLDIGSGGGDVPRQLARRARREGLPLTITAIDPDARAHAFATSRPAPPGVTFRCASSSDLVAEGASFDVVLSNHVLHHLDDDEREIVLRDSAALARRLVLHNDLRRSARAYALWSLVAAPLAPGSFIRVDGLRSIRRSYRSRELQRLLPAGWRAERSAPFRLLAVREVA